MSRIGKKPITLPKGVTMERQGTVLKINGPKGSLSFQLPSGIEVASENGSLLVIKNQESQDYDALQGMVRTVVQNMVTGVSNGFERNLVISGVGYRAEIVGDVLKMLLGFSAPVEYRIPKGVTVKVDKQVNVVVSGIDKQLVGQVAAEIRQMKKPEPYKGKGIKYAEENVRRKVGKSVGAK